MKTVISSNLFFKNLLRLKEKMKSPLPSDIIYYQCVNCNLDIPINGDGVIKLVKPLDKHLGAVIDETVRCSIERHTKENKKCATMICIHPVGTPVNILVSFPESDYIHIKEFKLGTDNYKVKLLITQDNSKAIFALYQRENSHKINYLEFIKCNFETFLNIKDLDKENILEAEIIFDDESMNHNQHSLPRLSGGGRSLHAIFNYQCLWCSEEELKLGKKGRFKELRSYRKHFRDNHLSEEGNGVPMAEFIDRVRRSEPTWLCEICHKNLSLGNAVRHKAICKPENSSESDSDTIEDTVKTKFDKSSTLKKTKEKMKMKKYTIYSESSSDEEESAMIKQAKEIEKDPQTCITMPSDAEETNSLEKQNKRDEDIHHEKSIELDKIKEKARKYLNKDNTDSKRNNRDDSFCSSDEQNFLSKIKQKKKQKIVNTDYTFLDVEDELYCSSPENNSMERLIVPKLEPTVHVEIDILIQSDPKTHVTYNKWWKKVPIHLYGDRDISGPRIFLPTDTIEFVERCTKKYNEHIVEKKVLDKKMQEAESSDAKLLQFSEVRDREILTKYTDFVQTSSAKDVLNIFSEEYEQLNIPTGAKSSTAAQYSHKILEFFKYMASVYNNFHLDWMVDFKGTIEKTYQDGSRSKDIFLPTKKDLTEFIKKFKYGSNPAANCGIRIFALKKMLDFLKQEIKDHEHVFEGNILEKRKIVECLVQRITNLNEGICPDGTIKVRT